MKKNVLLICGFLLLILWSQAQTVSFQIVPNSLQVTNLTSTQTATDSLGVNFGDSLEYRAQVIYNSANVVFDTLGFGIARDSLNGSTRGNIYSIVPLDSLASGIDTVTIIAQDVVDSTVARYSGGTGGGAVVVVIWPVLRTMPSNVDSGITFVLDFGEIIASNDRLFDAPRRVCCFPNPAKESLFFKKWEPLSKVECVRIMNMQGQTIFLSKSLPARLSTENWVEGVYFVEIRYGDNRVDWMKVER